MGMAGNNDAEPVGVASGKLATLRIAAVQEDEGGADNSSRAGVGFAIQAHSRSPWQDSTYTSWRPATGDNLRAGAEVHQLERRRGAVELDRGF